LPTPYDCGCLVVQEIIEGLHQHGLVYEEEDYRRILTILSTMHSKTDKEETVDLREQFKQLHNAFSADTV